jgi:hypothetical protein
MLSQLRTWLVKWRDERRTRRFNSGFDYAAGALLRGEKTPFDLDVETWILGRNEFDQGIDAAIDAAVRYGVVTDNRINPITW